METISKGRIAKTEARRKSEKSSQVVSLSRVIVDGASEVNDVKLSTVRQKPHRGEIAILSLQHLGLVEVETKIPTITTFSRGKTFKGGF
jgi:hypothetical protein